MFLFVLQNGRSCLGDFIYRYITSDQFSPECLLDCLDLSSEHVAVEIANRVEASIHVWRARAHSRTPVNPNRPITKSSWEMVKDYMADVDKRELLADRAENILLCLKQRFPGLTQTTLDTSKIQFNKVPFLFLSYFENAIFVSAFAFTIFRISGCWKVHIGELLKSSGEHGVQHRSSYRRFAICG